MNDTTTESAPQPENRPFTPSELHEIRKHYTMDDAKRLLDWLDHEPAFLGYLMIVARGCGMPNWYPAALAS